MTHPLKIYLSETKTNQADFAKKIEVRPATVSAWLNGTTPRPEQMKRVETETDGAVPVLSWFQPETTA